MRCLFRYFHIADRGVISGEGNVRERSEEVGESNSKLDVSQ